MTLREKFEVVLVFTLSRELHNEKCEQIADDYAIEILERYHNSLFNIPLKEGEAKEILKHLKK